jgi:hypothetical protein
MSPNGTALCCVGELAVGPKRCFAGGKVAVTLLSFLVQTGAVPTWVRSSSAAASVNSYEWNFS